jgi:hypothetical protein
MRVLPRSPRRRRRLGWISAAALAIALVVAGALALPSHAHQGSANSSPRRSHGKDVAYQPPRTVRPSAATSAQARRVVSRFVLTAVLRDHVARSWGLVTPALRSGFTKEQWSEGAIPVVPYPKRSLALVKWKPLYSYRDELGYQLLFMPKLATDRPVAFDVTVRRVRTHWLVSSWVAGSAGAPLPAAAGDSYTPPHRPSALWLLLPAGIFGLILTLPLLIFARDWYRDGKVARKAARA